MQKSDHCICEATITIPHSQCLYQCRKCHAKGVFLCHILQCTDPMLMRCRQCKAVYSMFVCPKCNGAGVIKGFKSGMVYGCPCDFTAVFVSCNLCAGLLCLPPGKNYEDTVVKCKKCANEFKFTICKDCGECNYEKGDEKIGKKWCFNDKCGRSKDKNEGIEKKKEQKWNACKICRERQAVMVNTGCLHLSICQYCYRKQKPVKCPICSFRGMQYQKI